MNSMELESRYTSGVYGKRPFTMVRGEGATLWDENGRSYIDCGAGISVANVGHSHPVVTAAITSQASTLLNCPEMFYNDQRAQFLSRLAAILPGDLDRIFLCNSGTEAIEGAIKFARLSTGRSEVISTVRGFHGRTMGALSATHNKKYRQPFMPLISGFSHVPFNKIEAMETAVTDQTAAVIVEIVQGEGGVRPGSRSYFQALRKLCADRGALLILDEVQTGYGRTGSMFACEQMGIVPDIICLGKAIAAGVPMGAIGLGGRVTDLPKGSHGSTFGGNPLACAVANAVLDIYEAEGLVERSAQLGARLLEKLQAIQSPIIRDVRGMGLMIGIELRQRVMPFVLALMAEGIVVLNAGPNVLRLLPPLVISEAELDVVVERITAVLQPEVVG
ncbi:MAG: aspartate aminotransferase family protein [Chloroflexota bacterium]